MTASMCVLVGWGAGSSTDRALFQRSSGCGFESRPACLFYQHIQPSTPLYRAAVKVSLCFFHRVVPTPTRRGEKSGQMCPCLPFLVVRVGKVGLGAEGLGWVSIGAFCGPLMGASLRGWCVRCSGVFEVPEGVWWCSNCVPL